MSTGFKDTLRSSGKLLLPIHCEPHEGHAEGHWALLVIEAKGKITYDDTMNKENEGCLKRAKEFVEAVDMNPDLVVRGNKFRHTGPGSSAQGYIMSAKLKGRLCLLSSLVYYLVFACSCKLRIRLLLVGDQLH